MVHILLTGGAGFIGSHIAEHLLKNGHNVRILDNLSTGNIENIKHLLDNQNLEFIIGDITDLETVKNACKSIDIICNQAALGSVPRSIDDPLASHNNNVNGFLNILVVAKEMKIKRIVYASSSSVYGDSNLLPKVEDIIGNPLSPYAITKYINELYAQVFYKLYGIQTIGLRYFNVFGPRQNPNGPYAAVIPKFISSLLHNEQPIINGSGDFSRDFTYVDNVVNANSLALFTCNMECFGQIFNIGAGSRISILDMFNSIKYNMNSNVDPIFGDARIGDVPHSNADISKASKLLGYAPIVQFNEGIKKTIDHFTK
jgi:UDP-N-acetylglucosamine 4-epimerase